MHITHKTVQQDNTATVSFFSQHK